MLEKHLVEKLETEEERRRRLDQEEARRQNPNISDWDLFLISLGYDDSRR